MTVRSTMTNIILELRGLTDASDGETTVNGVEFWTDEQLQTVLDNFRIDALDLQLIPVSQKVAGSSVNLRYYFPDEFGTYIETDFVITDVDGNVLAGWSYTPGTRYILFATPYTGTGVMVTGNSYNIRKAAAKVWLTKASQRTALIDWKAGGQTLAEDQEYQHCMQKFNEFAGPSGVGGIVPGIPTGTRAIRLVHSGYASQADVLVDPYPLGLEDGINGPIA